LWPWTKSNEEMYKQITSSRDYISMEQQVTTKKDKIWNQMWR